MFANDDALLGNLVVGLGGFIAAGCFTDEESTCVQRFVVRSADGDTWTVVRLEVTSSFWAWTLRVADDRLYALGYAHYGEDGGAEVWTSLDGSAWSAVTLSSFRNRAIDDIIESPLGTLAIGYEAPVDSDNTSGFLLWPVATDGSFGTVRAIDTGGDPNLVAGAIWSGKEYIAWGLRHGPWAGPTIVLASRDAKDWSIRAKIPGTDAIVQGMAADGGRLIAVGHGGRAYPLTPRAWISDDVGRSWTRATVEGTDAAMREVQIQGARLIAWGDTSYGSERTAIGWESVDGATWTMLPADDGMPSVPGFTGSTPARIGSRTCVAGSFTDDNGSRGAIYCR